MDTHTPIVVLHEGDGWMEAGKLDLSLFYRVERSEAFTGTAIETKICDLGSQ